MSKYVLPDFTIYKPQYIEYSIKEIKKSFLYKDNYDKRPDKNKYQASLSKLISDEKLSNRDFKVLSYYLISLEESELFDKFYKMLALKINEIKNRNYFIRPFLSYIYNGGKNRKLVYELIKIIINLTIKQKERFKEIYVLVNISSNSYLFIDNIKSKFSKAQNYQEIQMICDNLLIKSTDEIYNESICHFIFSNYLNDILWSIHKTNIQKMKLELKKSVFKKILQQYKNNYKTDTYPKQWFNLTYIELGDPYDPINYRWKNLEDEKEIFRRWNIDENLEQFFEKIVGGDKTRKRFWKKYMDNIYRIEYFQESSKALVMEFKNHMFVEFAEEGNACYYYNKNDLNINEIRERLRTSYMSKSQKIKFLKQGIDKKDHRGDWEYKFDYMLSSLGYKKSRWY